MPLIIDGYNLLHAAGILGGGIGPRSLELSRLALLNFLAESLPEEELKDTTVVFDAGDAPWGTPRRLRHRDIQVRFASQYESADAQIEELIRRHSAPKRLTVVSSDHRIQRAARRRRARPVDSDIWYAEVCRDRAARRQSASPESPRPPVPLLAENVEYWIRQFGGASELRQVIEEELRRLRPEPTAKPADVESDEADQPTRKDDLPLDSLDNPFPEGYGDDLLDDKDLG